MKADKIAGSITKNYKLILIAVILILLVVFTVYFSKWIKRKLSGTGSNDPVNFAGDLNYNTGQMSISKDQANLILQEIFQEMDQYGTDGQIIVDYFYPLNKHDILYMIVKFGTKNYDGAGEANTGWWIDWASQSLNLIGWLKQELNSSERDQMKQIFELNGIPW